MLPTNLGYPVWFSPILAASEGTILTATNRQQFRRPDYLFETLAVFRSSLLIFFTFTLIFISLLLSLTNQLNNFNRKYFPVEVLWKLFSYTLKQNNFYWYKYRMISFRTMLAFFAVSVFLVIGTFNATI